MTRRLKRIAPLQFGKMSGILYAGMGLIFLPFFALAALVGMFAQHGSDQAAGGALTAGLMLGMAVFMPIFYGGMGFVFGVIGAALYNLVAGWVGGIEVEVE